MKDKTYYEKIITWDKEPNRVNILVGIILILLGIFYFYLLMAYPLANGNIIKEINNTIYDLGVFCTLFCTLVGGTSFIFLNLGENKRIKYIKIKK